MKKKEQDAKNAQAKAQNALLEGPRAEAGRVRVDVYNGSASARRRPVDHQLAAERAGRPAVDEQGQRAADIPKTTLEFAPNQIEQARNWPT